MNTEHLLLGLIIKQPDLLDDCQLIANLENPFVIDGHNLIFEDIKHLYSMTGNIDRRELMRLGSEKNIPLERYTHIISNSGFREQLSDYVNEIYEGAVKRKLQVLGHQIINCTDDAVNGSENYVKIARDTVDAIENSSTIHSAMTLPEAVKEVISKAIRLNEGDTQDYLKTGILSIDRLIHGLTRKTMSIIGARPSVGKSALGLTLLSNMAQYGITAGFISVEMSEPECVERIIQMRSGVSMDEFAQGKMNHGQFKAFNDTAQSLNNDDKIHIVRTTSRSIGNIRSIIRKLKNKNPELQIVFIDYLQKIQGDKREDKRGQVTEVSAILTDIANDLNIHVCALAQLNRDGDAAPSMKHLKESGSIEQDAHYIFLIHRDLGEQFSGNYDQDCNIFICKNRGGRTGNAQIKYNAKTTRFYDEVYHG